VILSMAHDMIIWFYVPRVICRVETTPSGLLNVGLNMSQIKRDFFGIVKKAPVLEVQTSSGRIVKVKASTHQIWFNQIKNSTTIVIAGSCGRELKVRSEIVHLMCASDHVSLVGHYITGYAVHLIMWSP
jgi:hypothetical protein